MDLPPVWGGWFLACFWEFFGVLGLFSVCFGVLFGTVWLLFCYWFAREVGLIGVGGFFGFVLVFGVVFGVWRVVHV